MNRLGGFIDLIFDTVEVTTNLVEKTHRSVIDRSVRRFTPPIESATALAQLASDTQKTIAGGVYESIRSINRGVRELTSLAGNLAQKSALLSELDSSSLATPVRSDAAGSLSWVVDYLQAVTNGLYGDYLSERGNPLDLGMSVRVDGKIIALTKEAFANAFPKPSSKVCVFVHGLSSTEWLWSIDAQEYYGNPTKTFGSMLEAAADYTPVYIRYNSGRHISENGQALSKLLSQLVQVYPKKIKKIALVGHSMGGLVARSAACYGGQEMAKWIPLLRDVFAIGAPNLGAPLEKSVNLLAGLLSMIDAAGAQVPATLLNSRSVGIKDLRFGYTLHEEWENTNLDEVWKDRRKDVQLLDGVNYHYLAATITTDPEHPFGQLVGDLLVRPRSASGAAPKPERRIPFHSGRVISGMNHIDLANHPAVYDMILQCLVAQP